MLEEYLKKEQLEAYKHQQLNYSASLPLFVNSEELPEPPEAPEWLQELMEED